MNKDLHSPPYSIKGLLRLIGIKLNTDPDLSQQLTVDKVDSPDNETFLMRYVKLPWKDLEPGDSFFVPLDFFTINPNAKMKRITLLRSRITTDLYKFNCARHRVGDKRTMRVRMNQQKNEETNEILGLRVSRDPIIIGARRSEGHSSQE